MINKIIYNLRKFYFNQLFNPNFIGLFINPFFISRRGLSEEIKKIRLDEMLILQRKHTLELNQKMIGTFQQVLIEKESKKSKKSLNKSLRENKKQLKRDQKALKKLDRKK